VSLFQKYAETLSILTGTIFQDEVSARLQTAILDFQTIPTKPGGDGGLDGLSDNCAIGYCCYGPEYDSFKDEKEFTADVIKKFKSDLRKLFEVRSAKEDDAQEIAGQVPGSNNDPGYAMSVNAPEPSAVAASFPPAAQGQPSAPGQSSNPAVAKKSGAKSKQPDLTQYTNKSLEEIMPSGKKLTLIKLIVNRFESNRIYKPLSDALSNYRLKSASRFVDPSANIVILGPKQLAAAYAVDEMTLNRAAQRVRAERVKKAAEDVVLIDLKDFDHKVQSLRELRPTHAAQIETLAETLRQGWRLAIAVEQELDSTAPALHFAFEQGRLALLDKIVMLMFESAAPWKELSNAEMIAFEIFKGSFESVYGTLFPRVCHGEVSRLVGECPIRWESPSA
jgi:hypothetical protein